MKKLNILLAVILFLIAGVVYLKAAPNPGMSPPSSPGMPPPSNPGIPPPSNPNLPKSPDSATSTGTPLPTTPDNSSTLSGNLLPAADPAVPPAVPPENHSNPPGNNTNLLQAADPGIPPAAKSSMPPPPSRPIASDSRSNMQIHAPDMQGLAAGLSLTQNQIKKITSMEKNTKNNSDKYIQDLSANMQELRDEILKDAPDEKMIDACLNKACEDNKAIMKNQVQDILNLKSVLTKEQLETMKNKMEK